MSKGTFEVKVGLAEMLKGGVIMDVMNPDQAKIAEDAGAVAVMALERIPALIREEGGIARMSDPEMIKEIQEKVSIPVMAKVRIGHFAEAHFKVPFVCGCRNLGEALRRIGEGAALIRTKGEAGSGNIVEAVRHMRMVTSSIKKLTTMGQDELMAEAKDMGAPFSLVQQVAKLGKLPVPNFAAGGVATPADASLMMQLGAETVFVGSGIFMSEEPAQRAKAIVEAVTYADDPGKLADISSGLKKAMKGLDISEIPEDQMLQERGW